jgi:hypothetical protein
MQRLTSARKTLSSARYLRTVSRNGPISNTDVGRGGEEAKEEEGDGDGDGEGEGDEDGEVLSDSRYGFSVSEGFSESGGRLRHARFGVRSPNLYCHAHVSAGSHLCRYSRLLMRRDGNTKWIGSEENSEAESDMHDEKVKSVAES